MASCLTTATASCAAGARFSFTSVAASVRACLTGSLTACAASLTFSAACCSTLVAGRRLETSQPRPKATTPAASGLPAAFCFTWPGASEATVLTPSTAECAAPDTVLPAECAVPDTEDRALVAVPPTRSRPTMPSR